MEASLRWRLDAVIALLSIIAAGVLGQVWVQGGLVAAVTIFIVGAMLVALIRRPGTP